MKAGDRALQTRYAGYRFRSRLEARWAVFFDAMKIPWLYESQGYYIAGRSYLPDFFLPDCGTWVEVKGDEGELDHSLMLTAAERLPEKKCKQEPGPRLLILGPIPEPPATGDLGWIGIDVVTFWRGEVQDGDCSFACTVRRGYWECECGWRLEGDSDIGPGDLCKHLSAFAPQCTMTTVSEVAVVDGWWGFGRYREAMRPRMLANTSYATPVADNGGEWLEPALDPYEDVSPDLAAAYLAARSARFEHGERGRSR